VILQRKLVLDDSPTLVLATVEVARLHLPGRDEDDIAALIDDGFLAAWDISTAGHRPSGDEGQKRREVRLFPDCIAWYARTRGKSPYPKTESQILSELLAPTRSALAPNGEKPFMPSTKLRLLLNCSSTLIIELILAKQLSVVPGTSWTTGPNGAAQITISSITSFLKSRRLP
jgi:hypothetical protein